MKLRHRFSIQQPIRVTNDYGEVTHAEWVSVASVWGAIRTLSAKEKVTNEQVRATATHLVEMRYTSQIREDYRLVFNGRIFAIDGIINVQERSIRLEVTCHEVKSMSDDSGGVIVTEDGSVLIVEQ